MKHKIWEYWVIYLPEIRDDNTCGSQQDWTVDLDQQGKQGWELVGIYPHPTHRHDGMPSISRAVFKREKGIK